MKQGLLGMVVICSLAVAVQARPKVHETPPDLTQGGKPDDTRDWRLGPIGANGWVFNRKTREGASTLARQILVTAVDAEGPAADILQVGDVILGTYGEAFDRDARKALADAINAAETEARGGRLVLRVWRDGREGDVALALPVLGSHSAKMPFACDKTDRIIDQAVAYLMDRPLQKGWLGELTALGLLATGREDVMPKLQAYARSICLEEGETLSIQKHVPMKSWHWAYKTLFLCEYYLRTKDAYVLPTIREHATKIAMGQSGAGTWGHTYAAIENAGRLHGHLGGYGAINQMGLTLMIDLVLAQKCGIQHPEVDAAVERGLAFFGYFIEKGTIPYGDHGAANEWFDDNGKSGAAALLFDLVDNQNGAQFFSEMVLGSAPNGREEGHTGCFWSHLWGGVGAMRAGDAGLHTFFDQMNWAFTLERQPNGRMAFQGNAGEAGDLGDPKTKWDVTGVRLLQLCAPRRVLYITGKETPRKTHLTRDRIQRLLWAGELDGDVEARSRLEVPEILALLRDPLPPIRSVGARTLAERKIKVVEQLIEMLHSENRYARYGAAEALSKAGFGSKAAADALIALMATDTDVTFQTYAIAALINRDKQRGLLSVAKPAIPVLLKMAVQHAEADPRRVLQHDIGRALFYAGRAQPRRGLLVEYGLEDIERSQLVPVAREILQNENGWARSTMSHWLYPRLTETELQALWGDIYRATREIAPSGIMFASGVRTDGLKLMADHRIKEGLPLAVWYLRHQKGHGNRRRVPVALEQILKYGAHAKPFLEQMEAHAAWYEQRRGGAEAAGKIREAIQTLTAMEDPPEGELVSIAAYIQ